MINISFLSGSYTNIVGQERYISEGRYVTAVVYALMLEIAVVIPSTVNPLNTTELQQSLDAFEPFKNQTSTALDIESTTAHRVLYSSAMYLDIPVVTSDMAEIQDNLKSVWESKLTGSVSVNIALQEPLVKDNG